MKYVHKFSPYFFKQLTRLVCFISVVYIGPGSMTSVQANDRDSSRKAQIAASVKLLNRAITYNTLKKPTAASRYLIDRLNYVSSDTKTQIEQVLAQLQQTTGKELYAIITRNPDLIDEEAAETKFKQETQDFSNQVHQASMLGDNSTLLTISFVKSAVGKKRWVNISYFQGTGITVGSQLVSHEITTPAFQSQLQNSVKSLTSKDDYVRALIYLLHQKLGVFFLEMNLINPSTGVLDNYGNKFINIDKEGKYFIRIAEKGDIKYYDGTKAYFIREDKKEIVLELLNEKGQVVKEAYWLKYEKIISIEEGEKWEMKVRERKWEKIKNIKIPINNRINNMDGIYVQAKFKNKVIKINIIIIDLVFERDINALVDYGYLYPGIFPSQAASQIKFKSSNADILEIEEEISSYKTLKRLEGEEERYPQLKLVAKKTGSVIISAYLNKDKFSSVSKVNAIEKPIVTKSILNLKRINQLPQNSLVLIPEGLLGYTTPVSVKFAANKKYYMKGEFWYPFFNRVKATYLISLQAPKNSQKLIEAKESNYCGQITMLKLISTKMHVENKSYLIAQLYREKFQQLINAGTPLWYHEPMTLEHEKVHAKKLKPALEDIWPTIQQICENIRFKDTPRILPQNDDIESIEARNSLKAIISEQENQIFKIWEDRFTQKIIGDHNYNGPTEQAEKKVVAPIIDKICSKAEKLKWKVCSPNICIGESPIQDLNLPKGKFLFVLQDEQSKQAFGPKTSIYFHNRKKITFSLKVYKDNYQEVTLKTLGLKPSEFSWDVSGSEKIVYGKTFTVYKNKIKFNTFGQAYLSFNHASIDPKLQVFLNYAIQK